jgi:hypothetical protein
MGGEKWKKFKERREKGEYANKRRCECECRKKSMVAVSVGE